MPHIERVLAILGELAANFPNHGLMLNERYLHHVFSHALQQATPPTEANLLDYRGPTPGLMLHPEWPTYKEATGLLTGGRYGRSDKKTFMPIEDGRRGGFIDFALGAYSEPETGVEFMLKPSWKSEEIVFDFMKLLDSRNSSFKHVISFGIILWGSRLPTKSETYRRHADQALAEAVRRLGQFYNAGDRTIYFVITEVASDGRRHHHYDPDTRAFVTSVGLPPFLTNAATDL